MSEECARSVPALAAALAELRRTARLVAFVTDLFGADSFDALTLFLHLPELAASVPGEFRDLAEPVRLPGCVPIPGPDVISPIQDRSSPAYSLMVRLAERFLEADGILVNSFEAVEPEVAMVLQQPKLGRPLVYPIGPLILADNGGGANGSDTRPQPPPRTACLEWLDQQPARSVIFVSFDSGGALLVEQMRELALGLELSGQRFLWVVRSPSDEGSLCGNYYDSESKKDPFAYLPDGFIERTKSVGLVRLNAVMLAQGVGAARLPEIKDKNTIAAVAREVMAGERKGAAVRVKVVELQKAAAESLRDGGAVTTALD
ncbi:UDP-glycosyltransferase 72B3-like [Panicum miliaceum]|uniref:UDP-glycosyltransferase 72B3-like n=1 Tax=Panicum miliaceum TaxID=4540 RepID=A0A3L6PJZ6_PANMI|nr:UDP-glycosyltransferase 72B3-like [Panicum miliaceum]